MIQELFPVQSIQIGFASLGDQTIIIRRKVSSRGSAPADDVPVSVTTRSPADFVLKKFTAKQTVFSKYFRSITILFPPLRAAASSWLSLTRIPTAMWVTGLYFSNFL